MARLPLVSMGVLALVVPSWLVAFDDITKPKPQPKRVLATGYPIFAHMADVQGEVRLVATISSDGKVATVRVASGPGLLIDPTKEMLSKWLFSPCAQPGPCEVELTFRFVLESGTCSSDCPNGVQFDTPSTITISSKHRLAIIN